MDFLNYVQLPFGYLLPFIVALTIIVFIHELGHFLVARWCGVTVEVFSIGFGREIYGWNDRHGTHWKICWLPLGGYVKFEGDANATSLPQALPSAAAVRSAGNFHGKPIWQRAAVVAAGPIANFILSIVIFASVFMFVGVPMNEPRVENVIAGSAAEKAGIKRGDLFTAVDGQKIETFSDLQQAIWTRGGEQLTVVIDRQGTLLNLELVPDIKTESDGFGGTIRRGLFGIQRAADSGDSKVQRLSPLAAIAKGTDETWRIVSVTFKYLGKLLPERKVQARSAVRFPLPKGAAMRPPLGSCDSQSSSPSCRPASGLLTCFQSQCWMVAIWFITPSKRCRENRWDNRPRNGALEWVYRSLQC